MPQLTIREDSGVINTIIKYAICTILSLSSLFAQRETVGVEFNQHSRHLDSLKTNSSILSMSYRNSLPSGTRITASLGLDYVKLFDNGSATDPILKSNNQIFLQLEGLQQLHFMYLKGAIQFYSIKGSAVESSNDHTEVLHNNIYRIFEFPIGAGFTLPVEDFDIYAGLCKTYFYGTHEKEININNSGTEASLGSLPRRTFKTELGLGIEGAILYHFTENLELEFNFIKYEGKDFSFRLALGGPLKRMLYIN